MELKDNICNKYINNKLKIYKVQLVTKDEKKNYIFIGSIPKLVLPILKKIESNNSISKDEKLILSNYYEDFSNLIEPNVTFIPSLILENDSILTIKKKILVYISNPKIKNFFNINNQLLFVKQSKINHFDKYQILNRLQDNFEEIKFLELKNKLKNIIDIDINCNFDIKSLELSVDERVNEDKIESKRANCLEYKMDNYNNLIINNRLIPLGYSFQNNLGKKILVVNPYFEHEDDTLINNIDINDTFIDENSKLLSYYGEIDNNTIYLVDYKIASEEIDEDMIYKRIMFPYLQQNYSEIESEYEFDNYSDIIKNYDEIVNNFNDIFLKINGVKTNTKSHLEKYFNNIPEKIFSFHKCTIVNATYYINYGKNNDLDINNLFIKSNVNRDVPFIRYKNSIENKYKIHKDSIYNKINQKFVTSKFLDANKYFTKYQPFYFNTEITEKVLDKWKVNNISLRERLFIKNEHELGREYLNKGSSLKLVFLSKNNEYLFNNSKYSSLIINDKGYFEVKFNFDERENISETHLNNNIKYCHKILSKAGLKELNKGNTYKNNIVLSLNSYAEIYLPKIKLSNIEKNCNNLYPFIYITSSSDSNKLNLKWIRSNNLESYESIKNYFIKLRKSFSTMSITEFTDLWIEQTNKLFKMSEIDARTMLSSFTETIVLEDFKRLPTGMEIDIIIEKTNQINADSNELYKINIINGNNYNENIEIYKFLEILFFYCYNKTKSDKPKVSKDEPIKVMEFATKQQFTNDDKINFDDDLFSSDEEEEDNPEINDEPIDETEEIQEVIDEETYSSDESGVGMTITFRNYFRQNRTKDLELFFFPTNQDFYSPYSSKCGAVDKRQPILLTPTEMLNLQNTNPDGYKLIEPLINNFKKETENLKISKTEWGSSIDNKNFFICPRIWCTRCKLVLTPEQLYESVSHKQPKFNENEGRCPFCNGSIIQGQTIQNDETIFIRRAHHYWADPNTKEDYKKTEMWNKYLKGTEKDAYVSFLDPSLHPKNMCMPCCNSNPLGNYKKCMIINTQVSTHNIKINIKRDLKISQKIDNYTLKENDLVLVKNQKNVSSSIENGIYKITKGNPIKLEKFLKLDIELQSGMMINVLNGKMGGDKSWEVRINDKNEIKFVLVINSGEDKYVLGIDKYPLGENKLGLVPEKIDELLINNSDSYVNKGKPKIGSNLFFRRGINQDVNNSFLSCMASVYGTNLELFIKNIITNITPEIFISINGGNLINQYYVEKIDYNHVDIFIKWCKVYKVFVDKFISKINLKLDINKLILKINQDSDYKRLYKIFYSFESFKKNCGNLNLYKDINHFWELFSNKIEWLFSDGLNIIILERIIIDDEESINIICPNNPDISRFIDFNKPYTLLIKQNGLYENLVFASVKSNKINTYSKINSEIPINSQQISIINSLLNLMLNNTKEYIDDTITRKYLDIDYNILPSISNLVDKLTELKVEIEGQVTDSFSRGIGLLLKNNLLIFTKPYGIDINHNNILVNSIKKNSFEETLDKLNQLNSVYPESYMKPEKIAVDENGFVFGIILNSGNISLITPIKYDNKKHKLDVIELNNYLEMDKNILLNISDSREDYINEMVLNRNIYNNIKQEISNFLSIKNKNIDVLKGFISDTISNPINTLESKRETLQELFTNIFDFLIILDKDSNLNNPELCYNKPNSKCSKNNKCKLGRDILNINLQDKEIIFRGSKCKLIIPNKFKDLYDKYKNLIMEEIIRYPSKNKNILNYNKNKTLEIDDKENIILNDYNFNSYITNMYKIHNIFLKEVDTYINKSPNKDKVVEITDIKEINTKKKTKKLLIEEPSEVSYPVIMATKKALDGTVETGPEWKEGQCIFPWNIKKNGQYHKNLDKCILSDNPSKGSFCATEVYPDNHQRKGVGKKFGYCPDGSPYISSKTKLEIMPVPELSEIKAVISQNKDTHKKLPGLKEGNCIIPFKYKGKWMYECIPSKRKGWRKWCPTSLNLSGPAKHTTKTFGYCLEQESNEVNNPEIDTNTTPKLNVTKSKKKKRVVIHKKKVTKDKCIFPFTYKRNEYNDCLDTGKGPWCPTKTNENGIVKEWAYCDLDDIPQQNTPDLNTSVEVPKVQSKKIKKIFTTKNDKHGKSHTGKKIQIGECKFPFSFKKKLHYDCIDTGKGPWCATSLTNKDLIKTWAYCLPDGVKTFKEMSNTRNNVTDETYDNIFAEKIKNKDFTLNKNQKDNNNLLLFLVELKLSKSIEEIKANISERVTGELLDKLLVLKQTFFDNSVNEELTEIERLQNESYYLELDYLDDIDSVAKLQDYVNSDLFTLNIWSLFMLERIYNIKFLILELNQKNDLVVNCGPDLSEIDDTYLVNGFIPLFYHDSSYKVVEYKNKSMFKLEDIPKSISGMFTDCFKKNNNFSKIVYK